jgi:N-acetylated-alpha-linked acidic dipeptidase
LRWASRRRAAAARDRRRQVGGDAESVIDNRLGSGSDYTVFLNFLGVPVADLSFDGPYGVYHSLYDNHHWVATGDPGFRYHVALVQLWGLVALRLAGAHVLSVDYEPYAWRIEEFREEVERRWHRRPGADTPEALANVRDAAAVMRAAAARFNDLREAALRKSDGSGFEPLNRQLLSIERALLDADGLPGRPWYRHLIYAPRFRYAPEVLPGVSEAIEAGDSGRARAQARRLADALRRAAAASERLN